MGTSVNSTPASPNHAKSVLLWFTGLSGAGKTTLAKAVKLQLEQSNHSVVLLDGDQLRQGLCCDLDFSPESRKENIRRTGEVSKLLVESGVTTLVSLISPYRKQREAVRHLFAKGRFIEIYCATPLEICENRDVKGLYRRARAGQIQQFTGISAPYEPPLTPELIVNSAEQSTEIQVEQVMALLRKC